MGKKPTYEELERRVIELESKIIDTNISCEDIEEKKKAEEKFKAQGRFLQTIIKTTVDGFWVLDNKGQVAEVNDAYCFMSGYRREEIIGKSIGDLDADKTPEEAGARIQRGISKCFETFEAQHRRKDGSIYPIEISATYLDVDDGKIVCFGRDITNRKKAETEISHLNDLMRYIIEHANSGVAVHDRDLRYIYVSQRYLDQYKVTEEDVIGRHHYEVFPDLPQKWRDAHRKALTGEVSSAERDPFPKADGTVDWTRWSCRPWYEANGSIGGVVVYTEVITDRVRAEEALRASEEKFRLLVENSPDAIFIQIEGRYAYLNQSAIRLFGAGTADELMGADVTDRFHPDFHESVRARIRSLNQQQESVPVLEEVYLRMDGSPVNVEVSAVPIHYHGSNGALVFVRDITDRIERQKANEQLQKQLIQARKMESVGRLAGGVAHEYNNMLSVIIGFTELAMEKAAPEDPLRKDLKEVLTAARRSTDITRQLLAFARRQTIAPELLDLNETVEAMLKMLRRLIGEDIDLAWRPGSDRMAVFMDPSQLGQILANLLVNARDAIAGVGRITIETGHVRLDEEYCADHPGFIPGDFIMLAVSDDGAGMDKETLENIFEPFFTTKAMGEGTGLGLPTVYGIVKQNQGFINATSEPGKGTTFRIYFPLHAGQDAKMKVQEKADIPVGRGETVLIVEDEASVLKLAKRILENFGYTVLAAATPGEAMALAKERGGDIHLLITDVVMPEMNGRVLARNLLSLYPNLKLLFMSGYTADVIAHHGVLEEGVQFIQKPFATQDLAVKVREVLDEPK